MLRKKSTLCEVGGCRNGHDAEERVERDRAERPKVGIGGHGEQRFRFSATRSPAQRCLRLLRRDLGGTLLDLSVEVGGQRLQQPEGDARGPSGSRKRATLKLAASFRPSSGVASLPGLRPSGVGSAPPRQQFAMMLRRSCIVWLGAAVVSLPTVALGARLQIQDPNLSFNEKSRDRAAEIVDTFIKGWETYKKYAWGHDEGAIVLVPQRACSVDRVTDTPTLQSRRSRSTIRIRGTAGAPRLSTH